VYILRVFLRSDKNLFQDWHYIYTSWDYVAHREKTITSETLGLLRTRNYEICCTLALTINTKSLCYSMVENIDYGCTALNTSFTPPMDILYTIHWIVIWFEIFTDCFAKCLSNTYKPEIACLSNVATLK
jgi:hypothetical protein